jgi:anionic cell wall polymer biosynthesis LytR-Cps2A-Psr (LCP) family protein
MDGELALKYARSRKSTSDFSRAARQQLIIESVVESLGSTFSLTSLGNVKDVYDSYRNMVYTNITPSEILYMSQYKDNLQYFDSVVLHYECGTYFTQMRV